MDKTFISWDDFHKDCDITATNAISKYGAFDIIIAVARGGLVPARIMAEIVKPSQFYTIGVKLYDGCNIGEDVEMYQFLPEDVNLDRHDRILIVDDISDSGKTLSYTRRKLFIRSGGAVIKTACPYWKPQTSVVPDVYSRQFSNDEWVVFPFERD